jgi:hypothetical protein
VTDGHLPVKPALALTLNKKSDKKGSPCFSLRLLSVCHLPVEKK